MADKYYEVPVVFTSWGIRKVKAKNIEEALEKATKCLPNEYDFIDDSLEIDYEGISTYNTLSDEDEDILLTIMDDINRCR